MACPRWLTLWRAWHPSAAALRPALPRMLPPGGSRQRRGGCWAPPPPPAPQHGRGGVSRRHQHALYLLQHGLLEIPCGMRTVRGHKASTQARHAKPTRFAAGRMAGASRTTSTA
jgi:hypothetical protein